MKRRFFIMILALLALFTCSCEQEQQRPERPTYEKITSSELTGGEVETGTIPGDYIYRAIHVGNKGLLLKYHIPTGTATTVCQDPFCDHDAVTCPFSIGPSQMSAIGNMLYYVVRSEDDDQMHLRSYNGDDMKIEELRASDGVIGNLFAYNYYLYFFEKLPTNVQEEFKTTVYHQKDVGAQKAYESTPFMVKVKSDAAAKKALRLVAALAEKLATEKDETFAAVDYKAEYCYETTKALFEAGFIKATKEKKVDLDTI